MTGTFLRHRVLLQGLPKLGVGRGGCGGRGRALALPGWGGEKDLRHLPLGLGIMVGLFRTSCCSRAGA